MEAFLPPLSDELRRSPPDVRTVFLQHGAFIHRSLIRLGVRPADADDALQEVLVVIHRRLKEYEPGRAALPAWLFGIALRVAKSYRRRLANRKEVAVSSVSEGVDERTPERDVDVLRARQRLQGILDGMSPEKRATFVLFELEGFHCERIAEVTGVPIGTVHSRLHAARREFERALLRLRAARGSGHG